MQFVLETGRGLDTGAEMQRRVFDKFGMTRTSMTWRDDFAGNVADGYGTSSFETHNRRSRPRAAGSMDTTIEDMAKFFAGFSRGDGLSNEARVEMTRAQRAIESAQQFPTLAVESSPALRGGICASLEYNHRLQTTGRIRHTPWRRKSISRRSCTWRTAMRIDICAA